MSNITELAIGASLCFFFALILSIINNFKEHIYIKSFVIIMIILGFCFFISIIALFIHGTWSGNFVYSLTMIIIGLMMFLFLNNEGFYLFNLLKKYDEEMSRKKAYSLKVILIIQTMLLIIGTSIFIVGFGGTIIIKLMLVSPFPTLEYLPQYVFLITLGINGMMIFGYGLMFWMVSIIFLKEFRKKSKRKIIFDWRGDYV